MVTLFTWYGKQQYNNPFAPVYRIVIEGSSRSLSLYLEQLKQKKSNHFLIFNSDTCSPRSTQLAAMPENWAYISNFPCSTSFMANVPPDSWYVLVPRNNPQAHKKKQTSARTLRDTLIGVTEVKRVFPFNDNRTALYLKFSGAKLLLINNREFTSSPGELSMFKEQLDLLIIASFSPIDHILNLRDIFRPRYTVASCPETEKTTSFSNLLLFSSEKPRNTAFRVGKNALLPVHPDSIQFH